MSFGTYVRYICLSPTNCWLFPVAVVFFVASETLTTVFFRFLAFFELIVNDKPNIFDENVSLYWGTLGIIIFLFYVLLVTKDFLLNLVILNAN